VEVSSIIGIFFSIWTTGYVVKFVLTGAVLGIDWVAWYRCFHKDMGVSLGVFGR